LKDSFQTPYEPPKPALDSLADLRAELAEIRNPQNIADIKDDFEKMSIEERLHKINEIIDVSEGDPSEQQGATPTKNGVPPNSEDGSLSEPFKILGMSDDGRANFISNSGRLVKYPLEAINKDKLKVLADISFWKNIYGQKTQWEEATNDIIRRVENKDFDESTVRGRGAWRDGDKISYHDGAVTTGEWDKGKIYLKLSREDIGVGGEQASPDLINKVKNIIMSLSFDTKSDAVRCMGWSVLAPFCGALMYRPSVLLTGESGTGKTKVQELFMRPMSNCIWADMRVTSTAGIRSKIGKDNRAVIFDEAGKETDKMKINFEEILAFVRSNYSTNSPDGFKGTKEGGYTSYKLNSIFGIASTDPSIENVQDENRILRIHFKFSNMTAQEWQDTEATLNSLITKKTCDKIRAYTWKRLPEILALAERMVHVARCKTNRDYRSSYADMLLMAAYLTVWKMIDKPTDAEIEGTLDEYYKFQPVEENRNETREIIDRLMDEVIEIIHEHSREKITILECLTRIYRGTTESIDGLTDRPLEGFETRDYKQHLARYGVKLYSDDKIAIAGNHHMIKKILGVSEGYMKIFKRFSGYVESKTVAYSGDTSRYSVIIEGIIKKRDGELTDDEKLQRIMF